MTIVSTNFLRILKHSDTTKSRRNCRKAIFKGSYEVFPPGTPAHFLLFCSFLVLAYVYAFLHFSPSSNSFLLLPHHNLSHIARFAISVRISTNAGSKPCENWATLESHEADPRTDERTVGLRPERATRRTRRRVRRP